MSLEGFCKKLQIDRFHDSTNEEFVVSLKFIDFNVSYQFP